MANSPLPRSQAASAAGAEAGLGGILYSLVKEQLAIIAKVPGLSWALRVRDVQIITR
jgi:hypothetical protein